MLKQPPAKRILSTKAYFSPANKEADRSFLQEDVLVFQTLPEVLCWWEDAVYIAVCFSLGEVAL